MIEISRAVSSSISSISAGIVVEAGQPRRTPATLAGDQLVAVGTDRANEDRLEDAVLADGRGQFVEGVFVELEAWLLGIGLDVIERDDANADTAGRAVR